MSAPSPPATPAPPTHEPPSGGSSADGRPARRWPRPSRVVAAVLVALVALGATIAIVSIRNADAAAEQRQARAELAAEVEELRTAVARPARDAQNSASALLRHQLLVVAGETPDATVGERHLAQLRTAADALDAADTDPPPRPEVLPASEVAPIFSRLAELDEHASDLAGTLRAAADDADAWLTAVRDLDAAARVYADTSEELPADDEPSVVADAWRAEGERLDAYDEAIAQADGHDATAPLADAHRLLVDGMRDLSGEAVERLDAGDLDGYNALLDERLGGEDPFGFAAALATARNEVADAAVAGPLEDARGRAMGLLTELEELRRLTPPRFAELP